MSMRRLYVGDIGEIIPPAVLGEIPQDVDLDAMSYRELYNLALNVGVNLNKLLGLKECYLHADMVLLGSNKLPEGFNIAEDVAFCQNCWQQFRGRVKNNAFQLL